MPIPFSCPYCGESTMVDEPFAGHSGPCVNCGKLVTVPSSPPTYTLRSATESIRRGQWQSTIVIGLFLFGCAIGLYSLYHLVGEPMLLAARQATAKRACAGNMRKIGQAIQAYHDQYNAYPPAYTVDAAGKRMHSWRVLILPYLGQMEQGLYKKIDLNQPWDSPVNTQFLAQMPRVYASPADANALIAYESNYVVIVGPKTMWPDDKSRQTAEVTDGLTTTLMLVEVPTRGNTWMDPRDELDAGLIDYQIGGDIGGNHNNGANVLFADGEVHFLRDLTTVADVEGYTTVNGGENVTSPGD